MSLDYLLCLSVSSLVSPNARPTLNQQWSCCCHSEILKIHLFFVQQLPPVSWDLFKWKTPSWLRLYCQLMMEVNANICCFLWPFSIGDSIKTAKQKSFIWAPLSFVYLPSKRFDFQYNSVCQLLYCELIFDAMFVPYLKLQVYPLALNL